MEGMDSNGIFLNQILVSFLPYQTNDQMTWGIREKEGEEGVVSLRKRLEDQKCVSNLLLLPRILK